jgi:photosystem II stability/assembly factor-like uncharacterized protein
MKMYLGMEKELLVVDRQDGRWQVEPRLVGLQVTCLAADPFRPQRLYCGTFRRGLWRSDDAGRSWEPVGDVGTAVTPAGETGITSSDVMSVAVSPTERPSDYGAVYAGTEPSALFRSEDGGTTWQELKALRELPSAPTWSFPPRPYTSHVRWITPDPHVAGKVYACIERGALVRSFDGGRTWEDHRFNAPKDTHTLAAHAAAPGRLYSAAGDGFLEPGWGYAESLDGGESWQRPDAGLRHHYLWSVAVDPANPETLVVTAAASPFKAHHPANAESTVYRKTAGESWQEVSQGLPETRGTVIPVLASSKAEAGTFYLLSNKGLYRSADAGRSWQALPIPWREDYSLQHQQALLVTEA